MSHFTTLQTKITDRDALVSGLHDMGFEQVEVHETPQPLFGYQGDRRAESAHVIVRRQSVGKDSNDIGFEQLADGTFRAWISEFDRDHHRYDAKWLSKLTARHAYHTTRETLSRQGFSLVSEESAKDGTVRLLLRRMT